MTVSGKQPWALSQLHLLLTGECGYECDHCFVWGGQGQGNTMDRDVISLILEQARDLGTIEWIYFEGGEPFLFFELLEWAVQLAHQSGFRVGIVSNAFWAEDLDRALENLRPLAGLVHDLSISNDIYHGPGGTAGPADIARNAATELGIPVDFISVSGPDSTDTAARRQSLSADDTTVCYRGRAAEKLAPLVRQQSWERFTACPWEDLRQPSRVHVDSIGNLHICQGLSIGNLFEESLKQIMENYDPDKHPVIGPLLKGGPADLIRQFALDHERAYADACHLCYQSRSKLRERFPDVLTPGQMYGMANPDRSKPGSCNGNQREKPEYETRRIRDLLA